jgi:hypothetical protein
MRVVSCGRGYKIIRNPVPKMPVELVSMQGKGKSEVQNLMLKIDVPKKYVSFK